MNRGECKTGRNIYIGGWLTGEVRAWRLKKRERTEWVDEAKSGADTPVRAG